MSIIDNVREHGLKYITDPQRIWFWFRSQIRRLVGYRIKESDAIAFSEAVTYKAMTCPDCVKLGHCRVCKCPINELFAAMDAECSDGKFPAFEEKRDWNLIWYNIRKFNFKAVWRLFRKRKHWTKGWKEYKEKNDIYFMKFYG